MLINKNLNTFIRSSYSVFSSISFGHLVAKFPSQIRCSFYYSTTGDDGDEIMKREEEQVEQIISIFTSLQSAKEKADLIEEKQKELVDILYDMQMYRKKFLDLGFCFQDGDTSNMSKKEHLEKELEYHAAKVIYLEGILKELRE